MDKILLGCSSCLLGKEVRYDGGHKYDSWVVDTLGAFADYFDLCPEHQCGMPIPREALNLKGSKDDYRMLSNKTAHDFTDQMLNWCAPRIEELRKLPLCGYILKSKSPSWVSSPIYIQNRYQPVQINNCTIANNNVPGYLCRILAGADLRNVIFHNPGSGSELGLMNYLSVNTTAYPVSISNSLFRSATVPSSRPELLTLTDNIMSADPMFLGTVDTSLGINQPEYYQLSALSPCIDSGTPDTEGLNLPPMDLAGNYRIANGRIDMGVYEYASEPWVSTDDPEVPPLPEGFKVSAYPNPLLNTSRAAGVFLEFTLPKKPEVPPVIEIFNIRGQKVKTIRLTESYNSLVSRAGLSHDVKQSGEFYSTVWNGRDDDNRPLASGTYIVKAITDRMAATTKITIIK